VVNPGSTDRAWVVSDGGLVGAGLVGFCIDPSGAESRRSVTHRSIRHRGMCPVGGDTARPRSSAGCRLACQRVSRPLSSSIHWIRLQQPTIACCSEEYLIEGRHGAARPCFATSGLSMRARLPPGSRQCLGVGVAARFLADSTDSTRVSYTTDRRRYGGPWYSGTESRMLPVKGPKAHVAWPAMWSRSGRGGASHSTSLDFSPAVQ
jgi:hypothetical protein